MMTATAADRAANSTRRVLFASMIGTLIEFFDFYIYATAAVLVFPKLFFKADDPTAATLQSLATFALAFFARPLGSAVFGHFGDRVGRKATLVAALLTMGLSTVAIGLLPTHASIGVLAPLLLALFRFGQGLGLGGEWGGAVLLAVENAPPGKKAWFGMFPQLGAPLGFLLSTSVFLVLGKLLDEQQFMAWGWRVPFLASALLVFVGLYVRLRLTETPAFRQAIENEERVELPFLSVLRDHPRVTVLGMFAGMCAFVQFYLMTVFTLSWGTTELHYSREHFLTLQILGVVFFGLLTPVSALLAQRSSSRSVMMASLVGMIIFGLLFGRIFGTGSQGSILLTLILGFSLIGMLYGPLGVGLSGLFPTAVRYTGSSIAFNFAGILGGSVTPYIATWLAKHHGVGAVGWYLAAAASVSLIAWLLLPAPREE